MSTDDARSAEPEANPDCAYCGHARHAHRHPGRQGRCIICRCSVYIPPDKRRIPPLPKVPFVQDQDFSTIEKIDAEIAFAEYAIRHEAENRTGETDNESWGQLNWNLNERYKMALEMLKDAKRALKRAGVHE